MTQHSRESEPPDPVEFEFCVTPDANLRFDIERTLGDHVSQRLAKHRQRMFFERFGWLFLGFLGAYLLFRNEPWLNEPEVRWVVAGIATIVAVSTFLPITSRKFVAKSMVYEVVGTSIEHVNGMAMGQQTVRLDERGISVRAPLHTTIYDWAGITGITTGIKFMRIEFATLGCFAIPIEAVSSEQQDQIMRWASHAAGGEQATANLIAGLVDAGEFVCPECDYRCDGTKAARCPECGRQIELDDFLIDPEQAGTITDEAVRSYLASR